MNDNTEERAIVEENLEVQEEKVRLKLSEDDYKILDKISKYRIISDSDTKSLQTIKKSIYANWKIWSKKKPTIYKKIVIIDYLLY